MYSYMFMCAYVFINAENYISLFTFFTSLKLNVFVLFPITLVI